MKNSIMKKHWPRFKKIIAEQGSQPGLFLSVLHEDGTILSANSKMIRTLHLKPPKLERTSFFELIHPDHLDSFQEAIIESKKKGAAFCSELYLKNGSYHPMKWQIHLLDKTSGGEKKYFCTGTHITDKRRIKKSRWPGLKQYADIAEDLNEGIILQDKNGEITTINQMASIVLDKPLQRLRQAKTINELWDIIAPETSAGGLKASFEESPFARSRKTGEFCSAVFSIKTCEGKTRRLKFNSQPLAEDQSDTGYAVVTGISDVTITPASSSQIQEDHTLFNKFMKYTPNLAWVVDENASLMMASQAFYKYFGLEENSIKGQKITDSLPADITEALFAKHQNVLETGVSADVTEQINWVNGKKIIFHITIFPIEGPAGKKLLGGYALTVSGTEASEKKLREANDRLMIISKVTSNAIWEWDMKTGTFFRNDALMDMIGYQPEGARSLLWWLHRIHPEDRERVSRKVKEKMDSKSQSWEDEYRFKCADGNYKYMHDRGFIVYENDLPVKMIGALQDLTDIKKLETELTEEKLAQQKRISETIIKVQEKERTRIGHELHDNVNQIISTAKLFVDLLNVTDEAEKEIKQKSIDYLILAIEEIRKLSRELVTPQLGNKSLAESIKNLVDDLRLTTSIEIKFSYSPDVDLISNGKKLMFFRVVQEQLKNTLKYSEATRIDILLTCKDTNVILTVKDNGIGFDTSKPVKGIGLLNIKERARFYNGEVKLETSPGNGCMLEVVIPFN